MQKVKTIYNIKMGDCARKEDIVTYQKGIEYASITGDNNPIHFETTEAHCSRYGKPIAHGMILAGFISSVIGETLPGTGCIYEAQTLKFMRPVFYDDIIETRITVISIDKERNRVTLKTECFNQAQTLVLTGEAVVLPPETDERDLIESGAD